MPARRDKPPVTGGAHRLPFGQLDPLKFEELCLWLVRREGYARAEHLGQSGSEQGRDVVAWKGGRRFVFQCKRVEKFGAANARKEIKKIRGLPPAEQPSELVFVVTSAVSADARKAARAAWGDEATEWYDERRTHYPAPVAVTWQRSFERLSPGARAVLRLASLLAPEPIPEPGSVAEGHKPSGGGRAADAPRSRNPRGEPRPGPSVDRHGPRQPGSHGWSPAARALTALTDLLRIAQETSPGPHPVAATLESAARERSRSLHLRARQHALPGPAPSARFGRRPARPVAEQDRHGARVERRSACRSRCRWSPEHV